MLYLIEFNRILQKRKRTGKTTFSFFHKDDNLCISSTGDATPQVPYSVLGFSLHERHQDHGACSEKGNETGECLERKSSEKQMRELRFHLQKRRLRENLFLSTTA